MNTVLTNPANLSNAVLTPTENWTLATIGDPITPFHVEPQGKIAGDVNTGMYSIFARFVLPAFTSGTYINSADFILHAESDAEGSYPLSVYVIANTWQVRDMTRDNVPRASGTPVLSFTVANGQDARLDLTEVVDAAYRGDGVITLLVTNAQFQHNIQNFAPAKALNISVSGPSAAP